MPRIDGHNITRGRTTAALWFSVLAGPIAALTMEQINYMIVPIACQQPSKLLWHVSLHAVPSVLILVTVAAGIIGWRHRARPARQASSAAAAAAPGLDVGAFDGRIDFMAHLGVWLIILSVLVLVAEWIPVFILHPCWGT
jgi:hypothetical protein